MKIQNTFYYELLKNTSNYYTLTSKYIIHINMNKNDTDNRIRCFLVFFFIFSSRERRDKNEKQCCPKEVNIGLV